jgi:DNA-binding NtrC family response regulator
MPPLRERGSDIALLFQRFLQQHAERYEKTEPKVSRAAWDAIEAHSWPGNVRELQNTAEQLVLLHDGGTVTVGDLPQPLGPARLPWEEGNQALRELPYRAAREQAVRQFEARYLDEILEYHGGNVTRAARAAGVSRRTLHRWLHRLKSGRGANDS